MRRDITQCLQLDVFAVVLAFSLLADRVTV